MTQGMKSRVTENNTPDHDVSQSVSSKEQTNSSRESAAEGLHLSHKHRENMEDSSTLNISRYRTHKCMIVHDPFLKDFDSGKFSKWFDVTNTVQFYSLNDILSKGTLVSKIKALSPEIIYPLAGSFSSSVLSQPAVTGLNIFTARARYSPRAGDILFDQ